MATVTVSEITKIEVRANIKHFYRDEIRKELQTLGPVPTPGSNTLLCEIYEPDVCYHIQRVSAHCLDNTVNRLRLVYAVDGLRYSSEELYFTRATGLTMPRIVHSGNVVPPGLFRSFVLEVSVPDYGTPCIYIDATDLEALPPTLREHASYVIKAERIQEELGTECKNVLYAADLFMKSASTFNTLVRTLPALYELLPSVAKKKLDAPDLKQPKTTRQRRPRPLHPDYAALNLLVARIAVRKLLSASS